METEQQNIDIVEARKNTVATPQVRMGIKSNVGWQKKRKLGSIRNNYMRKRKGVPNHTDYLPTGSNKCAEWKEQFEQRN